MIRRTDSWREEGVARSFKHGRIEISVDIDIDMKLHAFEDVNHFPNCILFQFSSIKYSS